MQNNLFSTKTPDAQSSPQHELTNTASNELTPICFRDLVPEINSTSYLTHSVYYYPAKFIPQVVRHCINICTSENDVIVDPFAGSGTVGLEAFIMNRHSYLLDLNRLLNHVIPIKIPQSKVTFDRNILRKRIDDVFASQEAFLPDWSNVEYWYPPEFLEVLSKYWGHIKSCETDMYTEIIQSTLVKLSKHFSYAEHKAPKLFKSKSKLKYVDELLQKSWKERLDESLLKLSLKTLDDINALVNITKENTCTSTFKGGVDSSSYAFEENIKFDALITSPPYLQAQEYIRTSKMDMYWLGYSDQDVKALSRLEIPYRKPSRIIETETLNKLKIVLTRKDLSSMLDSYFCHTINALENSMNHLKEGSMACIFLGNPKIDGIEVEIWRVFKEYFLERGYESVGVYEDKIKHRQLFGGRKNKNPDGMKSEFLLVLKKLIS